MPRSITVYYGMSGALKGTTIKALHPGALVLGSGIKSWKSIISKMANPTYISNYHYAALHLVRLKEDYLGTEQDLVVERGVSDMLYYEMISNESWDHVIIPGSEYSAPELEYSLLREERNLLGQEVVRKLLVMKDAGFIRERVFPEPTRSCWFKSVTDYLERQARYVDFTVEHNQIDEVIEITDAKDYITNTLKLDYGEKETNPVDL